MPETPVSAGREERPIRVCIVAPSLSILGGQAVAAQRLIERLRAVPGLEVDFLPHDPRSSWLLRQLQRVKYVRTVATSFAYVSSLLRRLPSYDVVHVFSASYWSFLLAPTPAILIGKWLGKKVVVNYRSGEAEHHLTTWPRTSVPTLLRADAVVTPSGYLVDVFARFGVAAESIANFVDPQAVRYRQRDSLRPVFLSNRNFQALYNVPCVLRAFAVIQRSRPDARLIVIGDGPERENVHATARALSLSQRRVPGRGAADGDGTVVRRGRRVPERLEHRQHAQLDHRGVRVRAASGDVACGGHSIRRRSRSQRAARGLRATTRRSPPPHFDCSTTRRSRSGSSPNALARRGAAVHLERGWRALGCPVSAARSVRTLPESTPRTALPSETRAERAGVPEASVG